jgi:uncharacterized membrane protein HdeD (DUF308 family)
MPRLVEFIIGVFLVIHGIYSLYTAYKGGPLRSQMSYSDTFLARKIFGKEGKNIYYNIIIGIIEIALGVIIVLGKN